MRNLKTASLLIALVMLLGSLQTSWAGSTYYYKNLSFTVRNPELSKGRVYLTPANISDTAYCTISKNPNVAKVEGNFSTDDNQFRVITFALPSDGYVLDCLTTAEAYASGNPRSAYIGNEEGYPMSSLYLIIDSDTANNCTKTRPPKGAAMRPVNSQELYASFVPAKKMSVRNSIAGNVSSAVKAGRYGEAANDLIVTGPLNKADLRYLNTLSQDKGLIRLDLSGANFTTVPDSAFFDSGLYEIKLPSTIEAVGNYAFANSIGLKPVKLPKDIVKGQYIINNCYLMNQMGVYDDTPSSSSSSDDIFDWLLW